MLERLAPEQHDTLEGVAEPAENGLLVGHVEARNSLVAAQRAGRLPHAIILAGPQGIGKATLAFHFVRHLLSGGISGEGFHPVDPQSSLFRQVATGAHPSVLHLTRPANERTKGFKTVLSVDEVRRIGHFLSMTSHDGGYRTVIVDPADDMRSAAANALLKNLEEPPSRTLFILISHSLGSLLPTIRSRCQVFRLERLQQHEMSEVLSHADDFPSAEGERSSLIDRANGSARTALILHQYGGLEIASTVDQLATGHGDVRMASRLAGAVSGRDRAVQFSVFNERALEILADAANAAAQSGDLSRAKNLSDAWQEARIAISETETYNLDQKQHALTMINRLNSALKPQAGRM
jgi:DNA polymerase-3 subunit delta'